MTLRERSGGIPNWSGMELVIYTDIIPRMNFITAFN